MGAVEIIGLAASVSLLSGWRLYLTVLAVGLAMRTGWLALPDQLASLAVLANPLVICIAGVGALAEFLADKVMWIDSLWDGVHTLVRPVGGALLALALVDPADPAWQVAVVLLGGGATLLTHAAKAGTRAVVNASPEPVSNFLVSSGEDIVTGGLLALAIAYPVAAAGIAAVLLIGAVLLLLAMRRLLARLLRRAGPRPAARR